ncbi:hypothetical protein DEJ21_15785 [Curtobacterium sp. MCSS17_006]|uniref:hypothetical protein n=1 Tax=Curtobacterium sp. MCSS17_006 TaxID=2175642 RepID=UPI000DA9C0EE|nr:hypothetical protein [Curtobacterium sp. MCSS17_006]PZE32891.1 hypothetical protein DEJ21_15785 [Curtobacterium sp. MCSS17_006]
MSRRTVVIYGGNAYTVADQDPDTVRDHIMTSLAAEPAFWLTVNATEGRFTRAQLLITATTEIAIVDDHSTEHPIRYETAASSTDDISD